MLDAKLEEVFFCQNKITRAEKGLALNLTEANLLTAKTNADTELTAATKKLNKTKISPLDLLQHF